LLLNVFYFLLRCRLSYFLLRLLLDSLWRLLFMFRGSLLFRWCNYFCRNLFLLLWLFYSSCCWLCWWFFIVSWLGDYWFFNVRFFSSLSFIYYWSFRTMSWRLFMIGFVLAFVLFLFLMIIFPLFFFMLSTFMLNWILFITNSTLISKIWSTGSASNRWVWFCLDILCWIWGSMI